MSTSVKNEKAIKVILCGKRAKPFLLNQSYSFNMLNKLDI